MNKLLLITGDLAAGKTVFSRLLAERYDIAVYNKDDIKEELVDAVGFSNREENIRLSQKAVGLMCDRFAEIAPSHRDLILEANFRDHELKHIEEMASERGYRIMTLCMQGNPAILYERFRNRLENENRHPAHRSVGIENVDDFERYLQDIRNEYLPGETIMINVNDFSYSEDEEILARIDGFMK